MQRIRTIKDTMSRGRSGVVWGSRGYGLREGGELGDKIIKSEKAMSVG